MHVMDVVDVMDDHRTIHDLLSISHEGSQSHRRSLYLSIKYFNPISMIIYHYIDLM